MIIDEQGHITLQGGFHSHQIHLRILLLQIPLQTPLRYLLHIQLLSDNIITQKKKIIHNTLKQTNKRIKHVRKNNKSTCLNERGRAAEVPATA